jgi:hypothetical protein
MRPFVFPAALAASLFAAGSAAAATPATVYVRVDGNNSCDGLSNTAYTFTLHCAKRTLQAGINAASARATVRVAAGLYAENVVVTKAVRIWGAGSGSTVVVPATSSPSPCDNSTLCSGASSNVFLIRSSDVTIESLTVDGNNPAISHGVSVGGSDIDARNGIIEDHSLGVYHRLTVRDVEVKNVFLRGINAGSGGNDFGFRNNTVRNVQGSEYSVGIYAFGARGTISANQLSFTHDGINVNGSRGVKILGNLVEQSGSGIHIDNNKKPAAGIADDLIQNNTVHDCTPGGYGIWMFVSHADALIDSNTVSLCSVGLAVLGQYSPGELTFTANTVLGDNSTGTQGIFVTTDSFGYGHFDVEALFTGNTVQGFETAALIEQGGGKTAVVYFDHERLAESSRGIENHGTVSVHDSCLLSNDTGLLNHAGASAEVHTSDISGNAAAGLQNLDAATLDASDNWWGSPSGPDGTGDPVTGAVEFNPFLTSPPVACN